MIEGNETVTFFEHKDDFLVAAWQAHLQDIEGNAIQQLFANQLKDRTGSTPKIKKPFLYYYYVPYGNPSIRPHRCRWKVYRNWIQKRERRCNAFFWNDFVNAAE